MSKPEEEKMMFPPPSDVLYKVVMARSAEIKGEKPHEDELGYDPDDLDPSGPGDDTLEALEVIKLLPDSESAEIIRKALWSTWNLSLRLMGSLAIERARNSQLATEIERLKS